MKAHTCSCYGFFGALASSVRQHLLQGNISGSSTQTCSSRSAGTLESSFNSSRGGTSHTRRWPLTDVSQAANKQAQ